MQSSWLQSAQVALTSRALAFYAKLGFQAGKRELEYGIPTFDFELVPDLIGYVRCDVGTSGSSSVKAG